MKRISTISPSQGVPGEANRPTLPLSGGNGRNCGSGIPGIAWARAKAACAVACSFSSAQASARRNRPRLPARRVSTRTSMALRGTGRSSSTEAVRGRKGLSGCRSSALACNSHAPVSIAPTAPPCMPGPLKPPAADCGVQTSPSMENTACSLTTNLSASPPAACRRAASDNLSSCSAAPMPGSDLPAASGFPARRGRHTAASTGGSRYRRGWRK